MVRFAGVSKRYGDLTVLDRLELDVGRERDGVDHRPVRLGQDHGAAPADDAGGSLGRRHLRRGRAADPHGARRRAGQGQPAPPSPAAQQNRHGVSALQPVPAHDGTGQLHGGSGAGAGHVEGRGRGAGGGTPRHGGAERQEGPAPGAPVRGTAAARGDRPGARHAAPGDVAGRGDLGTRSGGDRRGAGGDPAAHLGTQPHHADGHAPDGLRERDLRPGLLLPLRPDRGAGVRPRRSSAIRRARAPASFSPRSWKRTDAAMEP